MRYIKISIPGFSPHPGMPPENSAPFLSHPHILVTPICKPCYNSSLNEMMDYGMVMAVAPAVIKKREECHCRTVHLTPDMFFNDADLDSPGLAVDLHAQHLPRFCMDYAVGVMKDRVNKILTTCWNARDRLMAPTLRRVRNNVIDIDMCVAAVQVLSIDVGTTDGSTTKAIVLELLARLNNNLKKLLLSLSSLQESMSARLNKASPKLKKALQSPLVIWKTDMSSKEISKQLSKNLMNVNEWLELITRVQNSKKIVGSPVVDDKVALRKGMTPVYPVLKLTQAILEPYSRMDTVISCIQEMDSPNPVHSRSINTIRDFYRIHAIEYHTELKNDLNCSSHQLQNIYEVITSNFQKYEEMKILKENGMLRVTGSLIAPQGATVLPTRMHITGLLSKNQQEDLQEARRQLRHTRSYTPPMCSPSKLSESSPHNKKPQTSGDWKSITESSPIYDGFNASPPADALSWTEYEPPTPTSSKTSSERSVQFSEPTVTTPKDRVILKARRPVQMTLVQTPSGLSCTTSNSAGSNPDVVLPKAKTVKPLKKTAKNTFTLMGLLSLILVLVSLGAVGASKPAEKQNEPTELLETDPTDLITRVNNFLYVKEDDNIHINLDKATLYRKIDFTSVINTMDSLLDNSRTIHDFCKGPGIEDRYANVYLSESLGHTAKNEASAISYCKKKKMHLPFLLSVTEVNSIKQELDDTPDLPPTSFLTSWIMLGSEQKLRNIYNNELTELHNIRVPLSEDVKISRDNNYPMCLLYIRHEPLKLITCSFKTKYLTRVLCSGKTANTKSDFQKTFAIGKIKTMLCNRAHTKLDFDRDTLYQTLKDVVPQEVALKAKNLGFRNPEQPTRPRRSPTMPRADSAASLASSLSSSSSISSVRPLAPSLFGGPALARYYPNGPSNLGSLSSLNSFSSAPSSTMSSLSQTLTTLGRTKRLAPIVLAAAPILATATGVLNSAFTIANTVITTKNANKIAALSKEVNDLTVRTESTENLLGEVQQRQQQIANYTTMATDDLAQALLVNTLSDDHDRLMTDITLSVMEYVEIVAALQSNTAHPKLLDSDLLNHVSRYVQLRSDQKILMNPSFVTARMVITENGFYISLDFPIKDVNREVSLFKVIPIPTLRNGTYTLPKQHFPYMAVTKGSDHYIPLTDSEFNECKMKRTCNLVHPTYHKDTPLCGMNSFWPLYKRDACEYDQVPKPGPFFVTFGQITFYQVTEKTQIDILCINPRTSGAENILVIQGNGFIKMEERCYGETQDRVQLNSFTQTEITRVIPMIFSAGKNSAPSTLHGLNFNTTKLDFPKPSPPDLPSYHQKRIAPPQTSVWPKVFYIVGTTVFIVALLILAFFTCLKSPFRLKYAKAHTDDPEEGFPLTDNDKPIIKATAPPLPREDANPDLAIDHRLIKLPREQVFSPRSSYRSFKKGLEPPMDCDCGGPCFPAGAPRTEPRLMSFKPFTFSTPAPVSLDSELTGDSDVNTTDDTITDTTLKHLSTK